MQINKFDWMVFNAAWLGVMFAGVEIGLAISIGLSVLIVLYKTGFPHHAVLGRLPGTTVYRSAPLVYPPPPPRARPANTPALFPPPFLPKHHGET